MDPCPFLRITVDSLALHLPHAAKPSNSGGVHPTATPCFCKLRLTNLPAPPPPRQTALLPLSSFDDSPPESTSSAPGFDLHPLSCRRPVVLEVKVYTGRMGRTCGVRSSKRLGRLRMSVQVDRVEGRSSVVQSGWVRLGGDKPVARLHLVVRLEPDPRFVFQFGGEPECSPVVYQLQLQGSVRQPIFSCKFSADRNSRSRSMQLDSSNSTRGWINSFYSDRERNGRERKGWIIMIHDLSGSPIAAASMITPFVPSPGSDRVSRSNPGAWLILRANGFSDSNWKPWGRLEAWRERGPLDGLGYRFELVSDAGTNSRVPITESTMSMRKGGSFCIDSSMVGDFSANGRPPIRGLVMSSTVEGEGKVSKPEVQVGVQHVTCMADAALFIALSAAIDLSMDACRLFSHKLRKELCHDQQEYIS
ncbi:hypothetical protein Scep_008129 [Stephania cephalantha]|uniref:Uncharacterized protein n=1 Tax=Stephania cephalantha TaxID=152367 RepID=A0AAP0KDT1_9MAGN